MKRRVATGAQRFVIGRRLRRARLALDLSQSDVAERIDVSLKMICRYETGRCLPRVEVMVALCQLYDLTLDGLLGDVLGSQQSERMSA